MYSKFFAIKFIISKLTVCEQNEGKSDVMFTTQKKNYVGNSSVFKNYWVCTLFCVYNIHCTGLSIHVKHNQSQSLTYCLHICILLYVNKWQNTLILQLLLSSTEGTSKFSFSYNTSCISTANSYKFFFISKHFIQKCKLSTVKF